MKSFVRIFLLVAFPFSTKGQDTAVTLTPSMVDPQYQALLLNDVDGWLFKKGNDTNWAKRNIDVTTWQKLKPPQLSEKLADRNGRLECWLRLKINLDTSFRSTPFDLFMNVWAATDVYVDGDLIYSFGNTGANGKPFKEYNPTYKLPVAVNLEKGIDHVLAIHFVDYVSPFPPHRLKSSGWLNHFVALTLPQFKTAYLDKHLENQFFRTIWLWINVALCFLFWLLAFQNRDEKNLLLIALTSTVQLLTIYSDQNIINRGISNNTYHLLISAWPLLLAAGTVMGFLLMLRIFKRKIGIVFKIFTTVMIIFGIAQIFLETAIILIFVVSLTLITYSYYIITSWKTLRGAQWAVVAGILLEFSFGLSLAVISLMIPGPNTLALMLYTGVFLSFPISLLVYVAVRFKEIINEVRQNAQEVIRLSEEKKEQALNQQKILQEEVNRQTAELRNTLDNLKSTQAQLIQSEKMASLGELTAGIAHEIQNPLNFVNNFSEVNRELISEMNNEIEQGNWDEAKAIAKNIEENEEKIISHGKRADGIVKGMLMHSRTGTGQKELTDINALADEYLRLSYHGLRAKDKSFNAKFETHFDETIEKINVIPQDIGRVLLNLFTNAFYSVTEKNRHHPDNYEPLVSVSTKKLNGKIEIRVRDNGMGVPRKLMDKIFQPFFTTKPTGQGTGLGLSLSYDIIAKGHGGELKLETKDGEFAEFIILLPG
ncbi:MAG TPA: ATP-binding protein [Chitinophagaceae bacterium]|nr:ATP-binding protein [Chitinophagaceae bacterium]